MKITKKIAIYDEQAYDISNTEQKRFLIEKMKDYEDLISFNDYLVEECWLDSLVEVLVNKNKEEWCSLYDKIQDAYYEYCESSIENSDEIIFTKVEIEVPTPSPYAVMGMGVVITD